MKQLVLYLSILMLALSASYSIWYVGKMISYELMYESFVEETIKEMVKEESLR